MPRESRQRLHYRRARGRFPERWASGKISPPRPARSRKIQERPQDEGEGREDGRATRFSHDSRLLALASRSKGSRATAWESASVLELLALSRLGRSREKEEEETEREKERERDEQVMPYLSPSEFITNGIGVGSRSSERRYMRNRLFRLASRDRDHYAAVKS